MVLNFEDGSCLMYSPSKRLVGIKKNGNRPISVTFDQDDISQILHSIEPLRTLKNINMSLKIISLDDLKMKNEQTRTT